MVSYLENIEFSNEKPLVTTLIKSDEVNEMRIAMLNGQVMKEHKAPFPILVNVVSGKIAFDIDGEVFPMNIGDVIKVPAHVMHELSALEESIVRVTLIKGVK